MHKPGQRRRRVDALRRLLLGCGGARQCKSQLMDTFVLLEWRLEEEVLIRRAAGRCYQAIQRREYIVHISLIALSLLVQVLDQRALTVKPFSIA